MKKAVSFISVVLLLILSGSAMGGAIFSFFNARSEGQNVILEWKTQEEVDILKYAIERTIATSNSFTVIHYIEPKGDNSYYTYTDENIYKTSDNLYKYRIAIINEDGSTNHSHEAKVSVSLSSVKRTWGSIKAMFR